METAARYCRFGIEKELTSHSGEWICRDLSGIADAGTTFNERGYLVGSRGSVGSSLLRP